MTALTQTSPLIGRRAALGLSCALPLAACGRGPAWNNVDVAGSLPNLAFDMTSAKTGKQITAAAMRGRVVLLYFGYTLCPDVCPTTLGNMQAVLAKMKPRDAAQVRVLFVTVDPDRDTLDVLKRYTALFGPQVIGLRGTPDQLASLTRRYRVAYSVSKPTATHPYEVTHSAAVYVFDPTGAARLIVASLASTTPDIAGTAADLDRIADGARPGLLARLAASV